MVYESRAKALTAKPRVDVRVERAHDAEAIRAIQGSHQDTDDTKYPM